MKVFIVLEYRGDGAKCSVVDVYDTRDAAQQRVARKNQQYEGSTPTFHIITKSVKGMHGVNVLVDGKKRYLEVNIRVNQKPKKFKFSKFN